MGQFHQPADDYAVANLGQLKFIFSFDFTTYLATAPINLTAQAGEFGIDLAWEPGNTAVGTGFRIERRESMTLAGPYTSWHTLENLPWTSLAHRDDRLAFGTYVYYRVRAVFGETTSAPSNLASAVMWVDQDQDGTADGPPGDGEIPPVIDPPDDDDDGGGGGEDPGIDGDGDGDGDPDNDKDGILDIDDRYPNDTRRSEDIPVKFYGVIDLSQAEYRGAPINADGLTEIAIDDLNNVSFATQEPQGEGNDEVQIFTWKDGRIAARRFFENTDHRRILGLSNLTGAGGALGSKVTIVSDNEHRQDTIIVPPPLDESAGWNDVLNYTEMSAPLGYYTTDHLILSEDQILSGSTSLIIDDVEPIFVPRYFFTFRGDQTDATRYLEHDLSISDTSLLTSDNGTLLVSEYPYSGETRRQILADTTELVGELSTTRPFAITNERYIIGSKMMWAYDPAHPGGYLAGYEEGRGELGFLWTPQDRLQTFHDLLPEKYKKQLRSAVPFAITNIDPETGNPTIYFKAEAVNREDGEWRTASFTWEKLADGEVVIEQRQPLSGDPIAVEIPNNRGSVAGVIPGETSSDYTAVYSPPIWFAARPQRLEWGFDVPINGDVHPPATIDDFDKPEWWTSVAKASSVPYDPTKPDDELPLNRNRTLQVVCRDPAAAPNYMLVVPDAFKNLLEVEPATLGGAITEIEIRGKSYNPSAIDPAKIEIRPIKERPAVGPPIPDDKQLIATLQVYVVPDRKIDLGVWFVTDSTSPNSALPGITFPTAEAIRWHLNRTFRQACIRFERTATQPAGTNHPPLNIPFDSNKDGLLNSHDKGDAEYRALLHRAYPAKLNLLLINGIKGANPMEKDVAGFAPGPIDSAASGKVVVPLLKFTPPQPAPFVDFAFLHACAHEVGHELGLATRSKHIPRGGERVARSAEWHDLGLYPVRVARENWSRPWSDTSVRMHGLMWPQVPDAYVICSGWLRHEDWERANVRAQSYVK